MRGALIEIEDLFHNALLSVEDLPRAQKLCDSFMHRKWDRVLDAFARKVNPFLPVLARLNFGGYYWVADQCEVATDIMFKNRASLEAVLVGDHLLTARGGTPFSIGSW